MQLATIKDTVIAPALERLGLGGGAGVALVLGTGLVETGYRTMRQYGGGPALGWFQMEPRTHDDIWRNFLPAHPTLARALRGLAGTSTPHAGLMAGAAGQPYAAAMCRLAFYRSPLPLPAGDNPVGLCAFWKRVYNTPAGKGQADAARVALFGQAVLCATAPAPDSHDPERP
ncbi:hypothetical protein [Acetobacter vaccinii]|uniref:Lysozyme n=1 Tax=Acetobacter vaccinii TaxID=2592655 RepID=A0A5C1YPS7_9PROT|nr:hypothetical protein [Acetobacter vaccinii]QEO17219.1 hypothetical protein FLP30_05295 [Acetobacter vaccinii]